MGRGRIEKLSSHEKIKCRIIMSLGSCWPAFASLKKDTPSPNPVFP
jgi:hypothetical protein